MFFTNNPFTNQTSIISYNHKIKTDHNQLQLITSNNNNIKTMGNCSTKSTIDFNMYTLATSGDGKTIVRKYSTSDTISESSNDRCSISESTNDDDVDTFGVDEDVVNQLIVGLETHNTITLEIARMQVHSPNKPIAEAIRVALLDADPTSEYKVELSEPRTNGIVDDLDEFTLTVTRHL